MDMETRAEGDATVLSCTGRLTMVAAPRLKSRVDEVIAGGSTKIVVDLTETSFIDSSGLGALVSSLKAARQAGGDLRLAGAGEQVRTVLSLTNLDRVLRSHPTLSDATDGW
jgi:anti-sigma B factor antagonist